ncbi:LysR family transcriptional regulator [Paenibacillus sp. J5C_2022]|uniref:LysR family transcriptional regulator n=1 Tax=Paenibacillus sp. J5C2022 TaxID=2977129 RepID=UPI0021CFFE29|nr:LysR family transcriptional regulator [Paenibacillus sp. J5C2022]MCU6709054.1 LysR family transcriptional regulator [Paenibacillus sp. J5C2022]
MSIVRFEIVAKVDELGSFTKAAEQLNMTQSAVSHAIAGLEAEWGVTLFHRDRRRGVALTDVGRKTIVHMREVLNRMENIRQEIALASSLEIGTIRIGTFASASACLLPKILSTYQKRYPKIEFRFYEGTYEEISEWLHTGIIDIGFVVPGAAKPSFELVPLIKDKMVVAFPPEHKFHSQRMIRIQQLRDEPFIMPTGMYRVHVEELFRQAHMEPAVRFEVHDCNTIANMVREGLGVTIGPELFLQTQTNLKLGRLDNTTWREVALACPSASDASPAAKAFLAVAKEVFADGNEAGAEL